MRTLRNWWGRNNPFALDAELHGPMRPCDKAIFIITATLGIWLVLFLIAAAYVMGGK